MQETLCFLFDLYTPSTPTRRSRHLYHLWTKSLRPKQTNETGRLQRVLKTSSDGVWDHFSHPVECYVDGEVGYMLKRFYAIRGGEGRLASEASYAFRSPIW